MADGEPRAHPRAEATLHAYYSRVNPVIGAWSVTRSALREITRDEVKAALDTMSGHRRNGTFVALRSLFGFAKRHRLIFADPTRSLHIGAMPRRTALPMTDHQVDTVTATAVTPLQRVAVALVAVYAVRGSALRNLLLDDVDLAGSRILLAGVTHRLTEFTHAVLTDWLAYRHQRWPHTSNPHLIVSRDTALTTEAVEAYHLTWHLSLLGIELEQIRADRVLNEALATNNDPLHLAITFGLSDKTAIDYAAIARTLIARPIEAATGSASDWD
ncbi:integrase [Nocardia sp. NPDC101769]|uniref:integrase n=1 Tax=Nocardia sp. NPDC101769 TaxID=3364333 RepID=UPI00382B2A1B